MRRNPLARNVFTRNLRVLIPALWLGVCATHLPGAEDAADGTGIEITRADLAASYLRFETVYLAVNPSGEQVARLNQGFDQATLAFFQNRYSESIQGINELAESLLPDHLAKNMRTAGSIGVRVDPPVLVPSKHDAVTLTIFELYPLPGELEGRRRLSVRLTDPEGRTVHIIRFSGFERDAAGNGIPQRHRLAVGAEIGRDAAPGVYEIMVVTNEGANLPAARLTVSPRPMDEIREEYRAWLEELAPANDAAVEAKKICTERLTLLTDAPSPKNSAQFMADMNALASEIREEINAIAADEDPYKGRSGDYWRFLPSDRRGVPFRFHAPQRALAADKAPLVIALHGAGGDENMFMEAYGGGMIRTLADEHGFFVASPATNLFAAKAGNFDALIESLAGDYPIDLERVYVIGHSMGAGAASGIAARQGRKVRATCCLAGGRAIPADADISPVLVVAAELDPIVPASRIEPFAREAAEAGLPVEYRLLESYGHTIMVTHYLPEAVKWLLSR